jgi:hypothetical protein
MGKGKNFSILGNRKRFAFLFPLNLASSKFSSKSKIKMNCTVYVEHNATTTTYVIPFPFTGEELLIGLKSAGCPDLEQEKVEQFYSSYWQPAQFSSNDAVHSWRATIQLRVIGMV